MRRAVRRQRSRQRWRAHPFYITFRARYRRRSRNPRRPGLGRFFGPATGLVHPMDAGSKAPHRRHRGYSPVCTTRSDTWSPMELYVPSLGTGRPPKERRTYCGSVLPLKRVLEQYRAGCAVAAVDGAEVTFCAKATVLGRAAPHPESLLHAERNTLWTGVQRPRSIAMQ